MTVLPSVDSLSGKTELLDCTDCTKKVEMGDEMDKKAYSIKVILEILFRGAGVTWLVILT